MSEKEKLKMSNTKEKKGIKGWLLFFVIVFIIVFPFLTITNLFDPAFISPLSRFWFYNVIVIMEGVFSLITGLFILFKKPQYINYLKIFITFYSLHVIINSIFLDDMNIKERIGKILLILLLNTFLYLYFKNSQRVKNTISG